MPTDISSESFTESQIENSIAVIGMSCKFPGATDPNTLWKNILAKEESIRFFSTEELSDAGVEQRIISDADYVAARGILTNVDKFDASFFGYSPYEASITDPQHKVFLEQAWAALENAGYIADQFPGLIGLFAGMADSTYLTHHLLKNKKLLSKWDEHQIMLATSAHFLCTKVAYALNLTGPCVNVSTACSTGLVSIIMACESLINYDSDMALAGGITIIVPENSGYLYQESGILSPDGHCRTFDQEAKGTVISNGCGIVVLRRLADALRDNDNIIAIVKGWSINNDGSDKAGFTAPSINKQAACVAQALAHAEIEPTEVDYLEAHGTGTLLGDPIEIAALTKGYQYSTHKKSQYCVIGSIKPNIGHTDVAAGVAGFIKTALALNEKILPPMLHYTCANKQINFSKSPFYVSPISQPWISKTHKRTAAVNSLGFGGTNAHLIMQEAPLVKTTLSKSANVLIISAKTLKSLEAATTNLTEYVQKIQNSDDSAKILADAAYTLQLGRRHFKWRRAVAYSNPIQLSQVLTDSVGLKKNTNECHEVSDSRVIFAFPGQGTQYANMALDIYQEHPVFKRLIDECCEKFKNSMAVDLREFLFPEDENLAYANEKLRHTQYAQLALFIVEYALARFLIDLGIKPHAMIGHSIGEYVAATISGVLNLEDALMLVAERAKLMAKTQPGAMLVVPMSKEKLTAFLTYDLDLAAHNAPELCVVSGTKNHIAGFENSLKPLLQDNNLSCTSLYTSHAFHSSLMEEILEEFKETTSAIVYGSPEIPYISNVTGNWITDSDLVDKNYWANHLRNTVRFSEGVYNLGVSSNDIFIEVGPGKTLSSLIRQHEKNKEKSIVINTLPQAKEYSNNKMNTYEYFLETISKLWLHDQEIVWKNLYVNEVRKRTPLPTYVFDDQRHWINPDKADTVVNVTYDEEGCYVPTWERDLKLPLIKSSFKLGKSSKCWLIFAQKNEFLGMLLNKLNSENHEVFVIFPGNSFSQLGSYSFTIAVDDKSHYLKLLETINLPDDHIISVHAWLLDDDRNVDSSHSILQLGAYSLLCLSQAFLEIYPQKNLSVLALANHVHKVLGTEVTFPEKGTVAGPCKVIPQEEENILYKFIDITLEDRPLTELVDSIYGEAIDISRPDCLKDIAYRGQYRWVRHFKPCSEYINANQVERLRVGGVYLITGGLGGIGLEIAKYLAKSYQANLILISRRELPPESAWLDDTHKNSQQVSILNAIKNNASSLLVKRAAVEDEAQMCEVITAVRQKFGRIDGVVHAAGIPGGGAAQLKTIEEYNKILQPKLQGTQTLIKLLKEEPLDFMVMFSSITAITGFPGQIDYCSANLVLDGYAEVDYFTHPVLCLAINWESWREVGMAATSTTKLIDLNEENSISPEEGIRLFKKILNSDLNQVVVSRIPPDKLSLNTNEIKTTFPETSDSFQKKLHTNQDEIVKVLTDLWQDTLGIEKIDLDDDFYELGGHSLLAISLLTKIHHKLGIKMPTSALLKAKTIRALSDIIRLNIQEKEVSPIVMLREGGDKSPLFMLHPVGGTAFCYLLLARALREDRTIYGLQDPSIEQEKILFSTLEEMATLYRKAIQKIQPKGPYYLCGSSFGATLAVEIAYQLLLKKEEVKFLGLIDGWATFSSIQRDENYANSIIHRHQGDPDSRVLPKNLDNSKFWEDSLAHRIKIMLEYQPKKIAAKLTLFKAKDLLLEYQEIECSDNHWSTYSTFPVDIYSFEADHNTILQEPRIYQLAQQIQACLDQ